MHSQRQVKTDHPRYNVSRSARKCNAGLLPIEGCLPILPGKPVYLVLFSSHKHFHSGLHGEITWFSPVLNSIPGPANA